MISLMNRLSYVKFFIVKMITSIKLQMLHFVLLMYFGICIYTTYRLKDLFNLL